MSTGMQVLFYKARGTALDRLIRWWTDSPYSHVELVLAKQEDGRLLCASAHPQDGGIRFKGKEYAQDFSYDAWAIDQLSEGIVPLFLPNTTTNLKVVDDSFNSVAAKVAARATIVPRAYISACAAAKACAA